MRALGVPASAGSRGWWVRFPFRRTGRQGCARGGDPTDATRDGFGSVAQERKTQPRLLGDGSQRWPSSFGSSEIPQFAIGLFFLSVNPHSGSLFNLLDAPITHGLVVKQCSTYLRQPSVDGRRQWHITWPAVRVVLQIVGLKISRTDIGSGS